jgi:hypothetical protein
MKHCVFLLALFLLLAFPLYSAAPQQRPSRETWYERVLRQINPDDTDYGAIWEQRKKAFMDRIGSPHFQYSLATTFTILWLLIVLYAQHVSHRRAEAVAVESIADVLRHDAYAREKAREAIRRYNDHIEACNRVIEAEESGASRWVSSEQLETLQSEVEQYRSEAAALREETKRLREECEKHKVTVAELSLHPRSEAQPTLPFAKDTRVAELVTRVNELQDELIAERKKNQRIKANSVK